VPRTNDEVARLLDELAGLTEIEEGSPQAFRVRAYQNAKRAVEGLSRDVAGMSADELAQVKGIGKSIAGRIREHVDTGRIGKLEELRSRHPAGQRELLRVPGLGPKAVQLLADELDVTDVAGLLRAMDDGRVAALPGMGERTVENLRRSIDALDLTSKANRLHLHEAVPVAERLVAALRDLPAVTEVEAAGSLRRFRETIGDLDLLVASDDPGAVTEAFLALDDVDHVTGSGPTKTSISTAAGLQVDLRVVPPDSFGAALLYFTGSKAHNIQLRQRALRRGWTLNEYALAELDEDGEPGTWIASRTEQELYAALELPWITPELREDDGELQAAEQGTLPQRVEVADLKGDLHDHTTLSGDGRQTLDELVAAAAERGLEYLAITDHAEDLRINGVDRDAMRRQRGRLRDLEERRGDLKLLHGAELNIGPRGGLDYDAEFLATFDWLVASVHSHFSRGVEEQTARVVAAIRHPSVTAIGHLTGRMIGRRPGIELDLEQVFDAAADTGTAIEINASLNRLDAPATVIREGVRRGVTFVISTDAHGLEDLDRARHGVALARRGWAGPDRIANTWPYERFQAWIDEVRGR
jgi:DNA polymerase (family 10)